MDTSADWVDIDENNGTLFVREGLIIDDDVPARENISFNISASDTNHTHTTSVVVYIAINDVNDRTPKIQGEQPKVHIKEKSNSGVPLPLNLTYQDLDRDVPFHTVVFQFYSNITNEAANLFDISKDGSVMVFLRNGAKLDRDRGPGSYILPILAYDNPTGVLQLKDFYDLTVVLDDINDNIPVILNKSLDCSEIMKKNDQLGPIIAQDLDEGENAEVSFTIVTIEAIGGSKELKTSSFEILPQDDNKTVFIKILQDLQGYYGQYNLTIKTEDHGNPPLSQNNSILLNVEKFNFQIPVFVYPESNANILLDDDPELNAALIFYNGSRLPDFEVDDLQDHKYNVSFSIIDKDGNSIFNIIQVKSYTARLELTRSLTDDDKKVQSITIAAALNADQQPNQKPTTASVSVNIQFFSTDDTPTFSETNCTISFQENCIGPPQAIPQASYPVDNFINPVYKLLDSIDVFNVNPVDGNISPLQELDYETTPSYDIRIAALNKESSELSNNSQSILYVHVKVSIQLIPRLVYTEIQTMNSNKTFEGRSVGLIYAKIAFKTINHKCVLYRIKNKSNDLEFY
ncbi:hypothetical protein HHI36_013350 [Cryptolaemus montrouzieri]|uniref:Cadherin domain-containing protein n=1 Tax=Cryptolaemus montrouzieri TaxID=559131 RepID=A0ABD2NHK0_9CUCU